MFDFSALKTTGMEIVFTKKNGEERTMRCTTNVKVIPSGQHPTGKSSSNNTFVKNVYDIDKQDWRSFRVDSVKSAKAL
jgi:hypothetical protein